MDKKVIALFQLFISNPTYPKDNIRLTSNLNLSLSPTIGRSWITSGKKPETTQLVKAYIYDQEVKCLNLSSSVLLNALWKEI